MTGRTFSGCGLGLLLALGVLAAGCRMDNRDPSQENTMPRQDSVRPAPPGLDVQTARTMLRADLDEIIKLVQPAEFTRVDPTGVAEVPLTCPLPDGGDGKSYGFKTRQSAEHVDDPEGRARLISDHWRSKGYTLQLRTELGYQVLAQTREGGSLSFIVSERGMTLSGESACVPA